VHILRAAVMSQQVSLLRVRLQTMLPIGFGASMTLGATHYNCANIPLHATHNTGKKWA
jgi:hypothetical protein